LGKFNWRHLITWHWALFGTSLELKGRPQKIVSAINFELVSPDVNAHHVSLAFVEVIPLNHNPSHESDPDGFTSCDNLFQSFNPTEKVNIAAILVEVNRLAPLVTECLADANLPAGLYK
jgi:hypothetical protein